MSAPHKSRSSARRRRAAIDPERLIERWHRALQIRDDWLHHGLSTQPADRAGAEAAIAGLYRLCGKPLPRFVWVDSPGAALVAVPGGARAVRAITGSRAEWPLPVRLATATADLRNALDARVGRPLTRSSWQTPNPQWTDQLPPQDALRAGAPLDVLLDSAVLDPLRRTLRDAIAVPLRDTLNAAAGGSLGLTWYGQHDAYWVAHYDVRRQVGVRQFTAEQNTQLDLWAALSRSCGWWWPQDEVCVVAERPAALRTEPAPDPRGDEPYTELRLHSPAGPAVRYPDGWGIHSWHGTRVPSWVLTGPTVELIARERNVEVRRCAIERIGWDTYIDLAGLDLVASAPDPGNPGCELHLYDLPPAIPDTSWRLLPGRVLLAVNGSTERDGRRRRYGLTVPRTFTDPVAAAGWSYGLSGEQYAQLLRRT